MLMAANDCMSCAVLCFVLQAMFAGFLEADKICRGRFKVSGTTATLAVVVGWEVFVANVGDSAAYLDTGKQVRLGFVLLREGGSQLRPQFFKPQSHLVMVVGSGS